MTDPTETPEAEQDPLAGFTAEELIREFGGIRTMAAKLGIPVTTVQGWKSRGRIPVNRRQVILEAARNHNIDLSPGAERQASKKPVTISSVPVSVEITDAEEARPDTEAAPETVSETKKPPKPEPPSAGGSSPRPAAATGFRPWRSGALALLVLAAAGYGAWLAFPEWFALPADKAKPKPPAVATKPMPAPAMPVPKKVPAPVKTPMPEKKPAPKPPVTTPKVTTPKPTESLKSPPKPAPKPPPSGVSKEAAREMIEEKTAEFGRRLAALSERAGKLGQSDKELAQKMRRELTQFRDQIASLRKDLAGLSEKLAALKQPRPVQGEKIALQALLLGQLEAEIAVGRPYDGPLERLLEALRDPEVKPQLDALAVRAARGIPTRPDLTKRFRVLARKIALEPQVAAKPAKSEENFLGWLRAKLKGLVSVRRVDGPGAVPPLSKAEAALSDGDFARAADHLEKSVSQSAARWVAPWVKDARAYAAAQDHLAKLRWHVSALLRKKAAAK